MKLPPEKEFKINEYITLRLEHGDTNIYVNGGLFNQCKFLMLFEFSKIWSKLDIEGNLYVERLYKRW